MRKTCTLEVNTMNSSAALSNFIRGHRRSIVATVIFRATDDSNVAIESAMIATRRHKFPVGLAKVNRYLDAFEGATWDKTMDYPDGSTFWFKNSVLYVDASSLATDARGYSFSHLPLPRLVVNCRDNQAVTPETNDTWRGAPLVGNENITISFANGTDGPVGHSDFISIFDAAIIDVVDAIADMAVDPTGASRGITPLPRIIQRVLREAAENATVGMASSPEEIRLHVYALYFGMSHQQFYCELAGKKWRDIAYHADNYPTLVAHSPDGPEHVPGYDARGRDTAHTREFAFYKYAMCHQ